MLTYRFTFEDGLRIRRDHIFFVGRDNKDFHPALRFAENDFTASLILVLLRIEFDAEKLHIFANLGTCRPLILTYATGEYKED